MKKFLALAISLVLITICVPCPVALAATDTNDFVGAWYFLHELKDGTLVNGEGYIAIPMIIVLNADYTAHVYDDIHANASVLTWELGTGAYEGMIHIWASDGRHNFGLVDGYLTTSSFGGQKYAKDIPPTGGCFRTDAALADFNGSWVVDYVLTGPAATKMSLEEFRATPWGLVLVSGDLLLMNAVTIDNGRVTDSESGVSQALECDFSFSRLTVERINKMDGNTDLLVFTLHEGGLMRYACDVIIAYYRRADTPEPTSDPSPEPTPDPTPEPTTEPTAEPTPEKTQEPETTQEETPLPGEVPESTPANNRGGSSGLNWLIITLIALAVVAVGVIVTSIIVWMKKQEDGSMAVFCTNCGKQIKEGAAFCSACGKAVSQTQPAGTLAAPVAAKKKSKAPLIIAGVAALVLAFALVGVFTQGFGLFGNTEETIDSVASGSVTPAPEDTPPATPTPENTPSETPAPEVTPSETPTPEVAPSESPAPEIPSPDLPPNHISAEFLDLLANSEHFYLAYMERPIDGELYGDLQYFKSTYGEDLIEEARQGDLYVFRRSTRSVKWYEHHLHKDNTEYTLIHETKEYMVSNLSRRVTSSTTGVSRGGLSDYANDRISIEFVGSGVGAINGVQMPYDDYSLSNFGEDLGRLLVYLCDDKVAYLVYFQGGVAFTSYSFTEVARDIPPLDSDISYAEISRNIPPDIFDIDDFLTKYAIREATQSIPGR